MKNSLQNKLFVWLSVAILGIGILASALSFWLAYNEAQKFQDDALHQVALLVDTYKAPLDDELFLESLDRDPKRIVVQPLVTPPNALPPLLKLPPGLPPGFHTLEIDSLQWRVYVHATALHKHIAIAQEVNSRKIMARSSALLTLLPVLVLVPVLILVLRQIVKAEMSSLRALAEIVDTQNRERLSVLPSSTVPREVTPFIHAINRMLLRINQMNETQRRFIANAAHELRSPLTALSLQAQNLERTGSFAITKDRLAPLKDGLERSRHLLNQMLDLVRQQASAVKPIPLDVAALALTVIEEIMPIADARRIDLGMKQEAAVKIDADAAAIKMMLRNAVDNALRYSPEGGEVTVRISRDQDSALLQVIDNGPGIPEAELERVFDAFYRLPDNTQSGSGLGLAIARSIAEQFKGKVTLGNRKDRSGLIFSYRQRLSQTSPVKPK